MDPASIEAANFFIADRLRGIPLVTGGKRKSMIQDYEDKEEKRTGEEKQTITTSTQSTTTTNMAVISTINNNKRSLTEIIMSSTPSTMRVNRLNDRRSIDSQLKPPTIAPKITTTTTTNLPSSTRKQQTTRRMVQTTQRPKPTQNSQPKIYNNSKHKSTVTTTTTIKPIVTKQYKDNKPTIMRSVQLPTENSTPPIGQRSSSVDYAPTNYIEQNSNNNLSQLRRANSSVLKEFDHQRRAPQGTVLTPRYTTKLNEPRGAGENWILFNRNDGQMSAFEVLVLISNIMIVSTILFVILFNWFKSFKKKLIPGGKQTETKVMKKMDGFGGKNKPSPEAAGSNSAINSRSPSQQPQIDGASDMARSMMSSALSGVSGPKQGSGEGDSMNKKNGLKSQVSNNIDKREDMMLMSKTEVGESQNISSEFKGGASSMANKAMAIVQPTENTDAQSTAYSDNEKLVNSLKEELKPIDSMKRSASDLSDNHKQANPIDSGLKNGLNTSLTNMAVDQVKDSSQVVAATAAAVNNKILNQTDVPTEKALVRSSSQISASSLESIELPKPLVESIKRSDKQNDKEAPSPNLLLGEVEKISVSQENNNKTAAALKKELSIDEKSAKVRTGKPSTTNEQSDQKVRAKPEVANKKGNNLNNSDRPTNPMGGEDQVAENGSSMPVNKDIQQQQQAPRVVNHQVVVNKLDKRKTNLEIVDLRDESVTGKMRDKNSSGSHPNDNELMGAEGGSKSASADGNWISMDGVAVVHTPTQPNSNQTNQIAQQQNQALQQQQQQQVLSPSEIMESRFNVDYSSRKKRGDGSGQKGKKGGDHKESQDSGSRSERESLGNIETELELLNNKMRNRKYFVYIVNDGHFTAKKECIARIELPPKRRITLAEMRQLITNSQDISLSSLRRNKFKFVTETYRLLNENEDAAVLHQVYPTQGVFLKLNVPEQESQAYPYKGNHRSRLSSSSGGPGISSSSLSQTTISSRRRVATRRSVGTTNNSSGGDQLPAIEVNYALGDADNNYSTTRTRASSVGRRGVAGSGRAGQAKTTQQQGAYRRSKSSVQTGRRSGGAQQQRNQVASQDKLPSIGRLNHQVIDNNDSGQYEEPKVEVSAVEKTLTSAATDLGSNVLSGAKRLFKSTFSR